MVECGDTAVLVTATRSGGREGIDFLPLICDYEERLYAAGRIPGSFMRRESRPPERATLIARLIDRPMRPLFPSWLRDDLQIVATCMSLDERVPPVDGRMAGRAAPPADEEAEQRNQIHHAKRPPA